MWRVPHCNQKEADMSEDTTEDKQTPAKPDDENTPQTGGHGKQRED